MKKRITAVRIAGAKPSPADRVISWSWRRTQRITTVGDIRITIRRLPELFAQAAQRTLNSIKERETE